MVIVLVTIRNYLRKLIISYLKKFTDAINTPSSSLDLQFCTIANYFYLLNVEFKIFLDAKGSTSLTNLVIGLTIIISNFEQTGAFLFREGRLCSGIWNTQRPFNGFGCRPLGFHSKQRKTKNKCSVLYNKNGKGYSKFHLQCLNPQPNAITFYSFIG